MECSYCHIRGHLTADYFKLKSSSTPQHLQSNISVATTEEESNEKPLNIEDHCVCEKDTKAIKIKDVVIKVICLNKFN